MIQVLRDLHGGVRVQDVVVKIPQRQHRTADLRKPIGHVKVPHGLREDHEAIQLRVRHALRGGDQPLPALCKDCGRVELPAEVEIQPGAIPRPCKRFPVRKGLKLRIRHPRRAGAQRQLIDQLRVLDGDHQRDHTALGRAEEADLLQPQGAEGRRPVLRLPEIAAARDQPRVARP